MKLYGLLVLSFLSACVRSEPAPVHYAPPPPPPHAEPEPTEPPANPPNADDKACSKSQDACADNEYCAYEPTGHCGKNDAPGVCKPKPPFCTQQYLPVCGCDNKTYGNKCTAAASGVSVLHDGTCQEAKVPSCGGIAGDACPTGLVCTDDPTDDCDPAKGGRDCMGTCVEEPQNCPPVLCKIHCTKGFARGPDGCEICACAK